MQVFVRRAAVAAVIFVTLIVIGSIGYVSIEGRPLGDSLYMTVITLTAVGYQEVFPLTPVERVFTMALLLSGITWLGLWFALITSFLVELDLKDALRRRRLMKDIARMDGHVIVCGAGRTGRQVAQELEAYRTPCVIIENDAAQVEALREFLPDAVVLEGDATHDHVLLEAGLLQAKGLVTCLSADTDNLFVCLSARDLAATLQIVARAYEEETVDKLYRAGADQVVSPNVSSAVRMASVMVRPSVVSFLDIVTRSADESLRMEQTTIPPGSALAGKTLDQARIPEETGLIVIATRTKDAVGHGFEFNPLASTVLAEGDEVIVLGREDQIERLRSYVG